MTVMLKHLELREWLAENQKRCPACGKRICEGDHLHHVFIRRNPSIPELYARENMALVCAEDHVPEAPGLNYTATLQKFAMGFTPREIRDWVASLPFKVKPGMPSWFVEAEGDYYAD